MNTHFPDKIMIYDCHHGLCANKTFIILPIGVSPKLVLPETEFKRLRLLKSFPVVELTENHQWHTDLQPKITGKEKYIYYVYLGKVSKIYQRQRAN